MKCYNLGNDIITDESVKLLTNLDSFTMYNNEQITNESIKCLTNLIYIDYDYDNERISRESLKFLTNLSFLTIY